MKEKVLIDLDDTIVVDSWKELTENYLGHSIDLDSLKPGTYVNQNLVSKDFSEFFITHNLYDYGFLDPFVVDFIRKLSHHYDVYIASIFTIPGLSETSSIFAQRKIEFLQKHFEFLGEEKFLIIGGKNMIDVDISIGDSMSDQIGKKKNFLLTRYHNKHITQEELQKKNSIRVDSWRELTTYFPEVDF